MITLLLALSCAPPEAPGPIPLPPSAVGTLVVIEGTPVIPWLADGAPPVEPPRIPWLAEGHPTLPAWSCPPGWRSVPGPDGEAPCDPWPEEGRVDCLLDHEAHFPGEAGCSPVGATCTDDGWPASPPEGALYVKPGGIGDGSSRAAAIDLPRALLLAEDGDTLALGAGTYDGAYVVDRAITLLGACPAATVLTRSGATAEDVVLTVASPGVALRDLSFADTDASAIVAEAGGELDAAGLAIARVGTPAVQVALGAAGATFTDVVWRETGDALVADAPTTVSRAAFVDVEGAAIFGASAEPFAYALSDVSVVSGEGPSFESGTGAVARLAVDQSGYNSLQVLGGSVTAEDMWARGRTDDPFIANENVWVWCADDAVGEASLTVKRLWLTEVRDGGVGASGYGADSCVTTLVVEDAVIAGFPGGTTAAGASASSDGSVTLERVLVTEMWDGLYVHDGDLTAHDTTVARALLTGATAYQGSLTLQDVAIVDLTAPYDWMLAWGVTAGEAAATLERVLVDGTPGIGIGLGDMTADVAVTDVWISQGSGPKVAYGMLVTGPDDLARAVTLSRVVIEDAVGAGLEVSGPATRVDATDLAVRGVAPDADGDGGDAVRVVGSTVTLERADLSDAAEAGVGLFWDEDNLTASEATLTDVAIHGIPACAPEDDCEASEKGLLVASGDLVADRLLVEGATLALWCASDTFHVTDAVLRAGDAALAMNTCDGTLERVAIETDAIVAEE